MCGLCRHPVYDRAGRELRRQRVTLHFPSAFPFSSPTSTHSLFRLLTRPSQKWRKSNFTEPGKRVIHPGALTDPTAPGGLWAPNPHPSKIFGTGTASESDHVADVWKNPGGDTEFSKAKNEVAEKHYKTVKREPLGRTFVRGHEMPDVITQVSYCCQAVYAVYAPLCLAYAPLCQVFPSFAFLFSNNPPRIPTRIATEWCMSRA